MNDKAKYKIPPDYLFIFGICVLLVVIAFVFETPKVIFVNYLKINTSRSVLVTDYVAQAGLGAALLNAAIGGFFSLLLLVANKKNPNGKIIAALFVTIGFSLFGKNMFNTIPIILGVWLYGKISKIKFSELLVHAMFSGTIGPLVSEIAFLNQSTTVPRLLAACFAGLLVGFIFPVITESAKRMHRGYCLYNSGIAGGLIATFFVGLLRSVGIEIIPEDYYDTTHTLHLSLLSYAIAVAAIIYGLAGEKFSWVIKRFGELMNEKDVVENDYYSEYGHVCYVNIGIMCILSTSLMLSLKIPINGPVLGGILTVAGFGAAGKHFRNSFPILAGSVAGIHFNYIDSTHSLNSLAVLFSTGLAPVCSKHGWLWGVVTGFLHVSVAIFIGHLNGGLNLYNNGFAGGFVAITLVPIIVFLKEIFHRTVSSGDVKEEAK